MRVKFWQIGCIALAWLAPGYVHAALGGLPFAAGVSAEVDARVARYRSVQAGQGYRVYPVDLNNGTLVQEFVDASGQVFALRWSGPGLPDMGMLLGAHLPSFKASVQAAKQAGKRGGPVLVQSGGLVLLSTGAMGAFQGYAYVQALVPPGLDVQSLWK